MSQSHSPSRANSPDLRAAAPPSRLVSNGSTDSVTNGLSQVLSNIADDTAVKGRHAKALRDATVNAINDVRTESKEVADMLTHRISQGTSSLLADLNNTFAAVGKRIDNIPVVASLSPDGPLQRLVPFVGSGEDSMQFSMWLRRLEDVMRMRSASWTPQQKAWFLIGYLDGAAREKVEELPLDDRESYDAIVAHLRKSFEGPQHRYMARQALSACKQQTGESSATFANRLLTLVRAATTGQDPATQKERVLEEFVALLRPDIRYYVKLDNPLSFEQAVSKAQMVEQLLAEATADRLITPSTPPRPIEVKTAAPRGFSPRRDQRPLAFSPRQGRYQGSNPRFNLNRQFQRQRNGGYSRDTQGGPAQPCYNCGGTGHFARQCPSPRNQRRPTGTPSYNVRSRSLDRHLPHSSPSSELYPARRDQSHDLSEAREQIRALSVSLRENQSALERSEARAHALIKRNEELAQSSFGGLPSYSSRSGSHHLPQAKFLLPLVVLSLCGSTMALPMSAWLCPQDSSDTFMRIPSSYNCSYIIPRLGDIPRPLSLYVYRPNTKRYDTPAFLCKIMTHTVTYSVNFFGARFENHSETLEIVPFETCKLMIQHHRCAHGNLQSTGDTWATSNVLYISWPSAPFGCCSDHLASATNCYVIPTVIHMRHGSSFSDSPAGDLKHCSYSAGSCTLRDGSALVWTPNTEEQCQFVPVTKMSGHSVGDIWISDSKEFALSWRNTSSQIQDCGRDLTISDQGYALASITKVPRQSTYDVGVVLSNQLAAQLLAAEGSMGSTVTALFHHALTALCDRTNLLALTLHTSLENDPTFTVRSLLGRQNLAASFLGNEIVRIHRCIQAPSQNVRLVRFNGTCYAKPAVELTLPRGTSLRSFIDPTTRVITRDAQPVSCSSVPQFIFAHPSGYFKYDALSGAIQVLPPSVIRDVGLPGNLNASALSLPLTIFHNLVLTNLSELVQDHQWQELWSTVSPDRLFSLQAHEAHTSYLASSSVSPLSAMWSFLFGSWSYFEVWVSFCCAIVSARLLSSFAVLYLTLYYPGRLPQFKDLFHSNRSQREPVQTNPSGHSEMRSPPPQYRISAVELPRIEIDATNSWPPRAIMSSVNVLSLSDSDHFFVAQIPIRVNNIHVLALVDTGASITVTAVTTASLFGIFDLAQSEVSSAVGMSGIPIRLLGRALLKFEIGSLIFDHPVYFTEGACIPDVADSYNIILGNDLLRRLPPWSIDYNTRTFSMANEAVKILCAIPAQEDPPVREQITVRVATTTVLPPSAETFVPCETDKTDDLPLMLTMQSDHLSDRSLMVTPAVINSGPAMLLIANPSPRPEVLYKGQQISSAVRLYEQFGSLEMPASSLCSTPLVGAVNNMAVRPLTKTCLDPEWIDLSHAEVSPEERAQLAQLFHEFRDRISTSTYDLGSYEESEIVIKTTTDVPPHRYRPPRVPLKFQKELDEHINRLLRAGRIVESDTPWVHNTVLVKKKDGSLRVCLDFRPLNEVTIPDHYPLPRIDDILSKISGHKYYTTLDLASGYMQLLLSPESQEKCGWITHRGIYQFVYLPFGLKNAGAYFCRAMSRILAGLEDNCLAYLDDIVVFDKDFPSHLASLRKVFHRFRLHNIKASGKKLTEIARSKINFLGHELSGHRYSPADRNIRAIRDFPTPTTIKEVKSFVGMANFFRKFIANFALIASPLYALLKDKAQFMWGIEQEEAFQRLKQLLTSEPCLAFPQDKEFFLHTDGSQLAVGAALFQTCFESPTQLAAVGYFSKALSDSQPRWVIELQSYNVTIEYLKGSSNVVADALSRVVDKKVRFEDDTPETDDIVEFPGEVLSEVGRLLRISRYFTTPYHHEGNGACERVFATFHPMLRTYTAENQLDWDRYVKACAFMYNTSVHTSTNNTPYFLMFGRDPVFNIDLLIKHDSERHTPSLDDAGLYVENLVATLHAAWRSAKDFNDRQRAKYKQQHDRNHLRPLDIRVGDRVFLRDLAPKVGLSSKLCNPWLGQFRVVEVDPPHLTIVSVLAPQSSPRRVHMNQVKRCYELSGPVFTSQWTPVEEQAALSVAGATEMTMPGYTHQIPPHFSMTVQAPGSGPNVDLIHAECPAPASVVDALMRSPELEQEAPTFSNLQVSDPSALDSNDAMDSSSFALQELDLSEDALLAPTPEPAATMEAGDGQLAQSREDLSLLSPAIPASSSAANPAVPASFGPIGWPDGAGPQVIPLPPAPPAAPRGRGGVVRAGARGAPAGGRARPRPRRGRAPVARHDVSPQRPYYPHLVGNPLPARENYLLSLHPWSRFVDLRPRSMVTYGHNRVTNELPVSTYRHLPDAGYMSLKFVRSLFPNFVLRRQPYPDPIPFIELQHLEDSIDIRFITADTIRSVQQGRYRDVDVDNVPLNTDDPRQSLIDPTTRNQRRPVLYQVVSTGWGTGVILEAKDFFLVGPDRRDLHCIVLDQYAINHLTGLRGFDKDKVSVKDFVWVYSLKPTRQALRKPEETLTA
uniref:RNA-directed DNA polymerase n=1 Tax=Haemonchus contortus TaxID=6289 RepID=A0A7I4XWY3_HAECO